MKYEKVFHTLKPVFDSGSRVLVLGSMPSPKSREVGFYYGHPQNRFWRVLAEVFDAPFPSTTDERKAFALNHRIALWDVIAECDITGAADSSIRNAVPNDFSIITSVCDIRKVFTVGRTASNLYKKFTGNDSVCLPSPSGANCAVSFDKLVEAYSAIAESVK